MATTKKLLSKSKIKAPPLSPKVSLTIFIEENHKLLTVLGVFTALTVFSLSLSLKIIGYFLSFAFFTISLIIWFELWSKFPKNGSFKLSCLENILSLTIFVLIFYWLVEYRTIWHEFLFVLFFMIIFAIFTYVMRKIKFFDKTLNAQEGKLKWLRYVFGVIVIAICGVFSFWLSSIVSPPMNSLLDELRAFIIKVVP